MVAETRFTFIILYGSRDPGSLIFALVRCVEYNSFSREDVARMLSLAAELAALPPELPRRLEALIRGLSRLVECQSGVGCVLEQHHTYAKLVRRCLIWCGRPGNREIISQFVQLSLAQSSAANGPVTAMRGDQWCESHLATDSAKHLISQNTEWNNARAIVAIRHEMGSSCCLALYAARNRAPFNETEIATVGSILGSPWLPQTAALAPNDSIPQRQRQVLELLKSGCTEKEAATHLDISRNTLHCHVKELYRRFGVASRSELLSLWLR